MCVFHYCSRKKQRDRQSFRFSLRIRCCRRTRSCGRAAAHEGTADVPEKGAQSTRRRQRQSECEAAKGRQPQHMLGAAAHYGRPLFPGTYASATQGGSRERRAAAAVAHEVGNCFGEDAHEQAAVTS
ncbi:MAG: hypothetical protein GY847_42170 [Proteobacteria bacterium]|nr:hypothetical protein [Pseudomonadota bacterium]